MSHGSIIYWNIECSGKDNFSAFVYIDLHKQLLLIYQKCFVFIWSKIIGWNEWMWKMSRAQATIIGDYCDEIFFSPFWAKEEISCLWNEKLFCEFLCISYVYELINFVKGVDFRLRSLAPVGTWARAFVNSEVFFPLQQTQLISKL